MNTEFSSKRKTCDCGGIISEDVPKHFSIVTLYSTDGINQFRHVRSRCNNRKKCGKYFYYGYSSESVGQDQKRLYEDDALEQEFLITSQSTAFELRLLYEWSLQILISFSNFEGLAEIYNQLHGGSGEELCEREKLCEKRVRDGWFTYNTLELRQRYNIEGPMSADVDKAMAENMYEIQDKFRQRWSSHRCEIPGCGSVIIIDGGQKAQRPICAAVSAGVKLFHNSNIQLVTGCTRNPGTRSKYCKDHREHEVPCILSKDIEQLALLKKEKKSRTHFVQHDWTDKVFIIEKILEKKTERTLIKYLIKFKDYETTVWQPKEKIPAFFVNQFDKTGITLIPRPKVLEERRKGTVSELILCKYWSVYNLHNTDY